MLSRVSHCRYYRLSATCYDTEKMKKNLPILILLLLLIAASAGATTYYVSPTGDDAKDGLTIGNAWLTIDRGDRMGVLVPGDTVLLATGVYYPASTMTLSTNGTETDPVVYRATTASGAILDAGGNNFVLLAIEADHIVVDGIELRNCQANLILVTSDASTISNCYLHDGDANGIQISGQYNTFLRNIVTTCTQSGFASVSGAYNNRYYGNTVYGNSDNGISIGTLIYEIVQNNIFVGNGTAH